MVFPIQTIELDDMYLKVHDMAFPKVQIPDIRLLAERGIVRIDNDRINGKTVAQIQLHEVAKHTPRHRRIHRTLVFDVDEEAHV